MPKVVYATEDALRALQVELKSEIDAVKAAAASANEVAALKGKLQQLVENWSTTEATCSAGMSRVASDAKAHTDAALKAVRSQVEKLEAEVMPGLISTLDADLRTKVGEVSSRSEGEIASLGEQLRSDLSAVKAELEAGSERWASQAAGAMVDQKSAIMAELQQLREDCAKRLDGRIADMHCILEEKGKEADAREERAQLSEGALHDKMVQLTERLSENSAALQEMKTTIKEQAASDMAAFREECEQKLAGLGEETDKLKESVAEVENLATRRVDWVIQGVSKRLRPPSASKAMLHASWFSPKFTCSGAAGLQLEVQVFRKAELPMEGESEGDCAVFLWGCNGMNLVYKLSIGSKSATLEKVFNGRVPYGTQRLCFLKDQISRENDTLRVSVEILEVIRDVDLPIKPATPPAQGGGEKAGSGETSRPLESVVRFRRHVNNRIHDQVKKQVEIMRCRMVRKIEWRVEQASMLRRCFPPAEPICSSQFNAAGIEGFQLIFYPSGYSGATAGFCSVFLFAPAGTTLRCWLSAGTQRREAHHSFTDPGAFGRTNFCRLETAVNEDEDTVVLGLEIEEAHQDLHAQTAHSIALPGDTRTQAQLDGAVPTAIQSAIKLQRSPGKAVNGMDEKQVLPSLWTAKSLGDRATKSDKLHSFDELRGSKAANRSTTMKDMSRCESMPSMRDSEMGSSLPQLASPGCKDRGRSGVRSANGLSHTYH